jgi:hypothetical protein
MELGRVDAARLSGAEQAELLGVIGRAEAMLSATKLKLLAAAEQAKTALACGAAGTGQWAAKVTNADQAVTHRQVGLAAGLVERRATATALAAGDLSEEHAAVIVQTDRRLPEHLDSDQRRVIEADLIQKARTHSPKALRRVARRALEAVETDPAVVDDHEDALVAEEERAATQRTRLTLHDNGDGTVSGHFTVPALQGGILRTVLEAMTAPRRARLGASEAQAGARKPTDWDRARGEAFCELLEHLPTDHLHAKVAATVVVTIDVDQLRGQLKAAGVDTGDVVSAGQARRLACTAGLMPAVLGGRSHVLDLGHQRRLFSQAQRVALGLRHQSCQAEGCERPYAWCELHHRQPWSQGGRTDLADAVPLCPFHHRRIHDRHYHHQRLPDASIRFTRRT